MPKITSQNTKEEEDKFELIEINELKNLPNVWMRSFSLSEKDSIDSCLYKYRQCYNHDPFEGWIYTNSNGQRFVYLKIKDDELQLSHS